VILHCSQKLAAKLPDVTSEPLEETSPLGSWHGHLIRFDRRQCMTLMHDDTRYALFLPGLRKDHFAVLGARWFRELYTAIDRSVQGSMRVANQDLEAWVYRVPNVMVLDTLAAATRLND
jgi:hypothetical protein